MDSSFGPGLARRTIQRALNPTAQATVHGRPRNHIREFTEHREEAFEWLDGEEEEMSSQRHGLGTLDEDLRVAAELDYYSEVLEWVDHQTEAIPLTTLPDTEYEVVEDCETNAAEIAAERVWEQFRNPPDRDQTPDTSATEPDSEQDPTVFS